ncbi:unnamed protein product [Adineta steineri]|uniref:Uncharacterized protein n=1 Tax=Adineta steineri TaxID=433720 RepID=A0A818VBK4_9BILA|nr:unnamed protein product [Adineta steineri]
MEWTYLTYTVADYGISIGLVLVAIIGVFVTFFNSKAGEEFIVERVIGVNPSKAHSDYDGQGIGQRNIGNQSLDPDDYHTTLKERFVRIKQKSIFYICIFCCLLGGMTLSITAVLLFQGCFLSSDRLLPGDDCPEYKSDCFIFGKSAISPITNNVSFYCKPLEKAQFGTNISDATAWCFGWIILQQTTKSVLDQLGIAIALIGFFTTMLAVVIYLGKCKKTLVLSIIFIAISGGAIIGLLVTKLSFSPLTYAILSQGVVLGIFGIVLFFILPKPEKQNGNQRILTANTNQTNTTTDSTMPYSKRPVPIKKSPVNAKTAYGPSKIVPK